MSANQSSLTPRSGLWRRWQEMRLIGQEPVLGLRPGGEGRMASRIERTAYLGSLAEYDLELAGQRVAAVRYDPGEADLYPVGATVGVELIEENLYLLPA